MLYFILVIKTKPPIKKILAFGGLALLTISLIYEIYQIGKVQFHFGQAFGRQANIVVNVNNNQGTLTPYWQNLAQGGEETKLRFNELNSLITKLQPKYIRIDHLYDFYNPVSKNNGKLSYDWRALDNAIDQILATGALPFFSLSYMPPAIAATDIVSPPADWNDWSSVVRATVQHYSGRSERNLNNVIYEVWNEPDLFGNWKLYGPKDYRTLYSYAVGGAQKATNVNNFKIGGPAITAPYKNWVDQFLSYTIKNKIRIDFYSWHRYTTTPTDYLTDIDNVDTWLFKNGGYTLDKYLTEWGPVSNNSPLNDSVYNAAHTVATTRLLINRADKLFTFEVYDGLSPDKKKYWGRWGLLTNPQAGPVETKSRYYALSMLNQMKGNRVELTGEGTWVTGFATLESGKIRIILVNLDITSRHLETFPVTINNLDKQIYQINENYLIGADKKSTTSTVNNSITREITLGANNVVLLQLDPVE